MFCFRPRSDGIRSVAAGGNKRVGIYTRHWHAHHTDLTLPVMSSSSSPSSSYHLLFTILTLMRFQAPLLFFFFFYFFFFFVFSFVFFSFVFSFFILCHLRLLLLLLPLHPLLRLLLLLLRLHLLRLPLLFFMSWQLLPTFTKRVLGFKIECPSWHLHIRSLFGGLNTLPDITERHWGTNRFAIHFITFKAWWYRVAVWSFDFKTDCPLQHHMGPHRFELPGRTSLLP